MLVHPERALNTPMRIVPCVALSIDGLLAGGLLLACSPAMGPVTVFADPGQYKSLIWSAPLMVDSFRRRF